jgi:hypothetical protein
MFETPQMVYFATAVKILHQFKLMGYIGFNDVSEIGFIGTLQDHKRLCIAKNFSAKDEIFKQNSAQNALNKEEGTVINVITQNFLQTTSYQHLVSKRLNDQIYNYLYDHDFTLKLELGSSDVTPMLISDPNDLSPLLIIQRQGQIKFYSFSNGKMVEVNSYKVSGTLHPAHSSAFLDLTGDLKPNLVLHMQENGKQFLRIYDSKEPNFTKVLQRLDLPDITGPIIYVPRPDAGCYDLAYVSISSSGDSLNIIKNLNSINIKGNDKTLISSNQRKIQDYIAKKEFSAPYSDVSPITVPLDIFGTNTKSVYVDEVTGLGTGIFCADLKSDGKYDIFLTLNINGTTCVRALKYKESEKTYVSAEYNDELMSYTNIIGISAFDPGYKGKEGLLINYVLDNQMVLAVLRVNNEASSQRNSKVEMIALLHKGKGIVQFIPGTTFMSCYERGNKIFKVSQCNQTTYPSLQHPCNFIGLGLTNFYLSYAIVSTALTKNDTYAFHMETSTIIPNNHVIFNLKNGKWLTQSLFKMRRNLTITISLILILVLNMIALAFLSMKEKKKVSSSKAEDTMKPLFTAL